MARLVLPDGPAQLLEAVRRPIAEHLGGEHEIHLGGGTALAARWQHRHSTDVDLFVDGEAYGRLFRDRERFRRDLERHSPASKEVDIEPGHARFILANGGEVSISTTLHITPHPLSADTVRGTGIHLETSAEILAKKINYRMMRNGEIVPRDLYDIASARRYAPADLCGALAAVRRGDLLKLADELRSIPYGWMSGHKSPLIAPSSSQDAARAVVIVRDLVLRHVHGKGRGDRGGLSR